MEAVKSERVRVYIPDDELVWCSCSIVQEVKAGHYEIDIDDPDYPETLPKRRIITMRSLCRQVDSLPLQNEGITELGVDDMCSLNYLHEPSILDNLRRRHKSSAPYTYTGEICIAINPYQWLDIYTTDLMDKHACNLRHEISPPHAYATSATAHRGLRDYNRNQSILVSGESGAGKTETVKILMGHIAHISGRQNISIIDKVLKANPLLESFGNAKTSRNDNSSRFGKFTRLQFDKYAILSGSRCVTYLLEKSRVIIQQNSEERNYHIFHQIFAAPAAIKASLHLGGAHVSDFRYTGNGDVLTDTIEGEHDGVRFEQTMQILQLLGVNAEQQRDLQCIIAGICFLGQVNFLGDGESSYVDAGAKADGAKCCELLGLKVAAFEKDTTVRRIVTSSEEVMVKLSRDQASDGRDALAKDIYDRLFQWLVVAINESTAAHGLERDRAYRGSERIIGLLDIFGFESFEVNRFEQLCINYANEKLQQKFTQDVFMAVQEEYKSEGLEWELIGYKDNADVLDLLEGRLGVMALLNEECLIPRGNDGNFLTKMIQNVAKHPCIRVGGLDIKRDEFSVFHYAGKVTYTASGFVELNRDAIPSELRQLMLTSTNQLLRTIFTVDADAMMIKADSGVLAKGVRSRQSFMKADTVTIKFRSQLSSLMETIGKTTVQYVRCIKPNKEKSKDIFDRNMVVEQLRCAGMIEAIRISRAAYPYRITHEEFATRFGGLRSGPWMRRQGARTPAEKCRVLLADVMTHLNDTERKQLSTREMSGGGLSDKPYEMGHTRVYFSSGVFEMLETMRGGLIFTHIKCLQRIWRGYRQRCLYYAMKLAGALIQKVLRGWKYCRWFRRLRRVVITVQTQMRRRIACRIMVTLRRYTYTLRLQSWARMAPRRRRFVHMRRAAVVLGRWMKMLFMRKMYIGALASNKENSKLSNQLDALKVRLSEAAVARETADRQAVEKSERERERALVLLDLQRREAAAMAEMEKQRVMEEARRALDEEKARLREEQEVIRLEALRVAQAHEADEAKKAQEFEALKSELAMVRAAQMQSEKETERVREEAKRKTEQERLQLQSEQEALRAEIMAEAQRQEAIAQEQANARLLKYHEREKEELLALEGLQSELARLRQKNDQLIGENNDLKSAMRREAVQADFRSGELAVVKVHLETVLREKDHIQAERDRTQRMMRQYKLEKSHVMEALLELSKDLDDANKVQNGLYEDVIREQRSKVSQEVQTVALLRSRGVNKAIVEDLRGVVYGRAPEGDTDSDLGSDRGDDHLGHDSQRDKHILASPLKASWLLQQSNKNHVNGKGGLANDLLAKPKYPLAPNAKARELARRRKQAFALRGDRENNNIGNGDPEPSVITQSSSGRTMQEEKSSERLVDQDRRVLLDLSQAKGKKDKKQIEIAPSPMPPSPPPPPTTSATTSGSWTFGLF